MLQIGEASSDKLDLPVALMTKDAPATAVFRLCESDGCSECHEYVLGRREIGGAD